MQQRSTPRLELKVIHRHRVGSFVFARVSELLYVGGRPKAVLGWINLAGIRTPLYICELKTDRLRQSPAAPRGTFYYDGTTIDPRYADAVSDVSERNSSERLA
jgi:hypothetical protein